MDTGAGWATVHGVARVGHDLATKPPTDKLHIRLHTAVLCRATNHCISDFFMHSLPPSKKQFPPPWGPFHPLWECAVWLYSSSRIVVTYYYKLVAWNNRNLFAHGSGAQQSKDQGVLPPGRVPGRRPPCLFQLPWLQVFMGLWVHPSVSASVLMWTLFPVFPLLSEPNFPSAFLL